MSDSRNDAADVAFERLLLGSAQADVLPQSAVRDAWSKFAGSAGALAAGVEARGSGQASAAAPAASEVRGALQWLALGALSGGLVTAAWMASGERAGLVPVLVPTVAHSASAALSPRAPERERASRTPANPAPSSAEPSRRAPAVSTPPRPPRASTLAAEVRALDAVRTAIAIGAHDQALRLVEGFHRDFPAAQLAADAEVLALEALAAQGNASELESRAARFLRRYPNDPQSPRVKALSARP